MIADTLIDEVRRLLAEGNCSQRSIARQTGVSRPTVLAIMLGRGPYRETPEQVNYEEEPAGPPEWCSSCSGIVYMPCRLCRLRSSHSERTRGPMLAEEREERPRLQLRPEHHARYEEVRAQRRQAAERNAERSEEDMPTAAVGMAAN